MRVLTLDFESYYSREYSLRRMSPAEYILDPRFQCTGLAVKRGDAPAEWVHGEDVEEFFRNEPTDVMCLSHNALFDMSICAWRYGWVPKMMVDTLGIARAILAKELKHLGLDKVGDHLNIGRKTGVLSTVLGMRREDIQARPDLYASFQDYGKNDVDICYGIFEKLVLTGEFPMQELVVMDMVLRCTVQPQFIVDVDLLRQRLAEIRNEKEETLSKAMLAGADGKAVLMSNPQFAELLRAHGVEPPMKTSPLTGKTTFAFAKTDQAFNDLLEHPNPAVQALVAARLDHKSTIEETRHERFISIASLEWPEVSGPTPVTSQGYRRLMPMPLRYSGAHTHRLSGDWKLNCMHPDVEVLTPDGWQRIEDWQEGTPIMQWWPHGELSWDLEATKVERDDTELVWFDSPFVKGAFTTDHRMPRVSKYTGEVSDLTAGEFIGKDINNIPTSGTFTGETTTHLSPNQVRIMVALAADGSSLYSGDTRQGDYRPSKVTKGWVFGFKKQRKADRLISLLAAEGIIHSHWTDGTMHRITIREANTPAWMEKGFGPWVLGLSAESREALLQELHLWDGWKHQKSDQTVFCTSKEDQAQWVQTVAHMSGQPCTLKKYEKVTSYGKSTQYYVYFRSGLYTSVRKEQSTLLPYEGKVYCPQVKSSYVIARYNNGIFITGNCQNLGRGSALRKALCAPEGYVVVAGDESQVEARITCTLAGQEDMRQQFENGEDVYSIFATDLFGRPITKANKIERFIGKTAILGLGYGLGKDKFTESIPVLAWNQMGIQLPYTPEEGAATVGLYRSKNFHIANSWKLLGANGIRALIGGGDWQWGPVLFRKEEIVLPNGMKLYYHNLRQEQTETGHEWVFDYGGMKKRIYGGKLLENIVQALARIIVMDAAVQVQKHLLKLGIRLALQVHDELVFVVKQEHEKVTRFVLEHELKRRPKWLPNLPLDCEIASGPTYGDAK